MVKNDSFLKLLCYILLNLVISLSSKMNQDCASKNKFIVYVIDFDSYSFKIIRVLCKEKNDFHFEEHFMVV